MLVDCGIFQGFTGGDRRNSLPRDFPPTDLDAVRLTYARLDHSGRPLRLMGLVVLGVGYGYWRADQAQWQTMVFLTITLAQMAHVLAIRSERDSLFRIGLWSNKPLLGAVALTFALQLALVYVPFLQRFFTTVALSAADLAIGLAASSLIFWGVELEKWLLRRVTIAGQPPSVSAAATAVQRTIPRRKGDADADGSV